MRDNHRNESIVPASPDVKDTSADNKLACGDAPSSSSSRPLEEAETTAADDTRISCRRGECWMKAIGMVIMMAFSGLSLALIPGGSSPTSSTAVNRPPPTPRPTHLPTAAPVVLSQTGHVAFTETVQLYEAVDAYFAELEEHGVVSSTANVSLVYGHPIGTWDVSRIVHFDQVFDPARHLRLDPTARDPSAHYHARTRFNDDLSGWDVSNATSLRGMFATASEFTGLGLDRWNVSNVQDFSFMFAWCTSFTGNVSAWNTSNAVYMNHLLFKAIRFDGDVSRWNLSSVVTTEGMFQEASSFTGTTSTNNHSLDEWSVSQVQSMNAMFRGARKFTGTISTWNTAMVLDMRDMVGRM
jgi:Mycoplasma protein of unknown function, DUF285